MEWNGENRLKAIYNTTARLEFLYDSQGRRFSKKVYAKSGGNWVLSSEKKFIFDGFKQIAEYNGTTLAQAYVWQPAGSGDFDVPLWMKAGSNVYTYVIDGNKNIRQLKNAAGTVVASYDYDPFGNVSATGSVSNNPWQFTGLIYYNYRYCAPSIGRWISRDPIEAKGGINIYCFVSNKMSSTDNKGMFDKIGMDTYWKELKRVASKATIWYCERAINKSGLKGVQATAVGIMNLQHAYISFGANPWDEDIENLEGYGFSGGAQQPGTLPVAEGHFKPVVCSPC